MKSELATAKKDAEKYRFFYENARRKIEKLRGEIESIKETAYRDAELAEFRIRDLYKRLGEMTMLARQPTLSRVPIREKLEQMDFIASVKSLVRPADLSSGGYVLLDRKDKPIKVGRSKFVAGRVREQMGWDNRVVWAAYIPCHPDESLNLERALTQHIERFGYKL